MFCSRWLEHAHLQKQITSITNENQNAHIMFALVEREIFHTNLVIILNLNQTLKKYKQKAILSHGL